MSAFYLFETQFLTDLQIIIDIHIPSHQKGFSEINTENVVEKNFIFKAVQFNAKQKT